MTCVTEPAIPFTGFFSPEHCLLQLTRLDVQGSGQVPRSVELLPIPLIAKGLLTGVYFGRGAPIARRVLQGRQVKDNWSVWGLCSNRNIFCIRSCKSAMGLPPRQNLAVDA